MFSDLIILKCVLIIIYEKIKAEILFLISQNLVAIGEFFNFNFYLYSNMFVTEVYYRLKNKALSRLKENCIKIK